jgi:4-hydroxy-tetrahydrodipicolinate synthase
MTNAPWRGVAVALVTIFEPDGLRADAKATAELARRLVEVGVRGLLVAGSTGEADALTDDERTELVGEVRAACPGVPLLVGASGAWGGAAADRVRSAVAAGADALLVAPPRRGLDLFAFYRAVAGAAGEVPVLAYNYPGVAGGEVPVGELSSLPVAGLKDSSGSAERLLAELAAWDGWTYVGAAPLTGYAGWLGATGAILAVANVVPEDAIAAWEGDADAQRRLGEMHRETSGRFPHALKAAVAHRFGTSAACRLG